MTKTLTWPSYCGKLAETMIEAKAPIIFDMGYSSETSRVDESLGLREIEFANTPAMTFFLLLLLIMLLIQ